MFPTIPCRDAVWLRSLARYRPGATRRLARDAQITAHRALNFSHALAEAITADGGTAAQVTFADPAVARIQDRRRRIEESGLTLIRGGAA